MFGDGVGLPSGDGLTLHLHPHLHGTVLEEAVQDQFHRIKGVPNKGQRLLPCLHNATEQVLAIFIFLARLFCDAFVSLLHCYVVLLTYCICHSDSTGENLEMQYKMQMLGKIHLSEKVPKVPTAILAAKCTTGLDISAMHASCVLVSLWKLSCTIRAARRLKVQ
jgi:hypothetical protein